MLLLLNSAPLTHYLLLTTLEPFCQPHTLYFEAVSLLARSCEACSVGQTLIPGDPPVSANVPSFFYMELSLCLAK